MTIKSTIQHGWEAAEEARDPLGIASGAISIRDCLKSLSRVLDSALFCVKTGAITPAHARSVLDRSFDCYCEGMSSRKGLNKEICDKCY